MNIRIIYFLVVALLVFPAHGFKQLGEVKENWFQEAHAPKVGVEVEIFGMTTKEATELVHKEYGGEIVKKPIELKGENTDKESIPVINYKIKRSRWGRFDIYVDDNSTGTKLNLKNAATEIVTPVLNFQQLKEFQEFVSRLPKLGAIGTEGQNPISTQFTLDFYFQDAQRTTEILLLFFRQYYSESFQKELLSFFNTPNVRRGYLGSFSPGMMARIMSPEYLPSAQEFFFDFMYRQVLELNGEPKAWSMAKNIVQQRVLKLSKEKGLSPFLEVVKWNDVKISGLLMHMFPKDPLTKILLASQWFGSYPAIEFRQANTDFKLIEKYKILAGLVQRAEAEAFLKGILSWPKNESIDPRSFRRLVTEKPVDPRETWVVRLMPHNLKKPYQDAEIDYLLHFTRKKGATPVLFNPQKPPQRKLILPGESVVYHSLPEHAEYIVGKYNPSLVNKQLVWAIERKDFEFLFWERFKPGAMPKTIRLSELMDPHTPVEEAREILNRTFPNGWVVKGVYDSATEKNIVTSQMDMVGEVAKYTNNVDEFQNKRNEILRRYNNMNPDLYMEAVAELPEFFGWRIKRFFKRPAEAIVQEFKDIKEEYRVEIVLGRVLGGSSTISRFDYEAEAERPRNMEDVRKVEAFAQELLDALPEKLKTTPFALDVAVLKNGGVTLIESNPGPNSGFLAEDKRSIKELNKALNEWPERVRSGEVSEGMDYRDQRSLIADIWGEHKSKNRVGRASCARVFAY